MNRHLLRHEYEDMLLFGLESRMRQTLGLEGAHDPKGFSGHVKIGDVWWIQVHLSHEGLNESLGYIFKLRIEEEGTTTELLYDQSDLQRSISDELEARIVRLHMGEWRKP